MRYDLPDAQEHLDEPKAAHQAARGFGILLAAGIDRLLSRSASA